MKPPKISDTQKVWFVADPHFGHANIIKFDNLPFKNTEEHFNALTSAWNERVVQDDLVFVIGDWCFNHEIGLRACNMLLGEKILICGNHEKPVLNQRPLYDSFENVYDYLEIVYKKQFICLFHYPIHEWNKCHYDSWMLHGHTHGNDSYDNKYKILNVGVNCLQNYAPISFEEVERIMRSRITKKHH